MNYDELTSMLNVDFLQPAPMPAPMPAPASTPVPAPAPESQQLMFAPQQPWPREYYTPPWPMVWAAMPTDSPSRTLTFDVLSPTSAKAREIVTPVFGALPAATSGVALIQIYAGHTVRHSIAAPFTELGDGVMCVPVIQRVMTDIGIVDISVTSRFRPYIARK